MLSTKLRASADTLLAHAITGTPLSFRQIRSLAEALYAQAQLAEAMEATKIAQDTADQIARILGEREGERG